MSPTALGEYCVRCGTKSTVYLEPTPEGDREVSVYRCPKGHGVQLIAEPAAAGPEGDPTETGILQWPLAETDTDVPLSSVPTTVVIGSVFLIDAEYMTVNDISNIDNPGVTRATHGSIAGAHEAGTSISIWGNANA